MKIKEKRIIRIKADYTKYRSLYFFSINDWFVENTNKNYEIISHAIYVIVILAKNVGCNKYTIKHISTHRHAKS